MKTENLEWLIDGALGGDVSAEHLSRILAAREELNAIKNSKLFNKLEKLQTLDELANIPTNMGQQFICVDWHLGYGESGVIRFGFNWKCDMGECEFRSLDEAITIVEELRKKAK